MVAGKSVSPIFIVAVARLKSCITHHVKQASRRLTYAPLLAVLVLSGCGSGDSASPPDDLETPDDLVQLDQGSLTADRQSLVEGESTTLRWNIVNGSGVTIEPSIGAVAATGEQRITPAETTEYILSATVAGEAAEAKLTVIVRPYAAVSLISNVTEGDAPLTVRLTPDADSVTAINRYYWDFAGDGGTVDGGLGSGANGFDRLNFGARNYDVAGRDVAFIYTDPGIYNPRIRVWDDAGNQAEATIQITVGNAPPTAYLRASPTSGQAPLRVSFTATAADNEGRVRSFEWDFDGDGRYDESTTSGRISHIYETPGKFKVGLRLTDPEGVATVLQPIHMEVNAQVDVVPTVTLSTRTAQGTAPLEVSFSTSYRDGTRTGIARWEWDFDSDGVVDSTEPSSATHTYQKIGNFYPSVRIIAANGASGTDILNVVTQADHSLALSNAAINPEANEVSGIAVSLKGTSDTSLVVENATGQAVRTLWPYRERATGEYTLNWDGKNSQGNSLSPGDYYAVLRYKDIEGVESVIDYRTTTGGAIYYPNGWSDGRGCQGSANVDDCGELTVSENDLEPFNNQPTVYSFSNPHNAKFTAYMTIIGSENYAPASFFRSRVMPPGNYQIKWFGEGSNGKMLPRYSSSSEGYLPAIYGLTASDNAIFLSHQTTLGELTATPAIVFPAERANNTSRMSFSLSRVADVVLTVDSTENGVEVLRQTFPNMPAGVQNISWDGRGNDGERVAPGGYRLSVVANDKFGQSTLPSRAMQRIEY